MGRIAERMEDRPILLRRILKENGIQQQALCRDLGINITTFAYTLRKGYVPGVSPEAQREYRCRIEKYLRDHGVEESVVGQMWQESFHTVIRRKPAACNPKFIETVEVEMINSETLRHFRIFRNPFIGDVQSKKDVYLSQEHRYVKEAMLDAAHNGGFVAVIGEVGSGKTIIRELVFEQLQRDDRVIIIFPQSFDKKRLTAYHIAEAIIRDISADGRSPSSQEKQAARVRQLLLERYKTGRRFVLVLEEAHDLMIHTLKYLKRFLEIKDGLSPVMGIILIAQPELEQRLDERRSYDIREVIRRCVTAKLAPFSAEDMKGYLALKFKRVGADLEKVFSKDGLDALADRLLIKDRYGKLVESRIYPLTVNNYTARGMNLAAEMGEARVSAEVVAAI